MVRAINIPFGLDDMVLRRLPGRLLVNFPGERERREVLKVLLGSFAEDVDLSGTAKRMGNFWIGSQTCILILPGDYS